MQIRACTYNIRLGLDSSIEAVGLALNELGPLDVVALQEVGQHWHMGGPTDHATVVADILGLHSIFCGALTDQDGGRYGIALLARFPITIIDEFTLVRADDEQRVCLIARIDAPHPFVVITSHFSIADQDRLAQSDEVINRLRDIDLPWILLGDFNARPESAEYDRIAQHGVDTFAVKGTGPAVTFSVKEPHRQIDYIFVSPENWDVRTAQVERHIDKSDHFPLTAELDLRLSNRIAKTP